MGQRGARILNRRRGSSPAFLSAGVGNVCFFLIPGTQRARGTSSYLIPLWFGQLFSGLCEDSIFLGCSGDVFSVLKKDKKLLSSGMSLYWLLQGEGERGRNESLLTDWIFSHLESLRGR